MLFNTRTTRRDEILKEIAKGNAENGTVATKTLRGSLLEVTWPSKPVTSEPIQEAKRMPTIGEQLKAARAEIAAARQEAANTVSDAADAARVVRQEIDKAKKEAADLRAEVAELTNGGPA